MRFTWILLVGGSLLACGDSSKDDDDTGTWFDADADVSGADDAGADGAVDDGTTDADSSADVDSSADADDTGTADADGSPVDDTVNFLKVDFFLSSVALGDHQVLHGFAHPIVHLSHTTVFLALQPTVFGILQHLINPNQSKGQKPKKHYILCLTAKHDTKYRHWQYKKQAINRPN